MIFMVNASNRMRFAADLLQMHRHRKIVFVDGLGWNIPVIDDFEIDRYDHPDTIYLLAKRDIQGPVLASARLLRTVKPHLMIDLFLAACSGRAPCGPAIWEASRFCPSPDLPTRRERVLLFGEIVCGVIETALAHNVKQVTYSANSTLLPLAMACGWDARALGPTLPDGEDELTAIIADITEQGLHRVRSRYGIAGPITQLAASMTGSKSASPERESDTSTADSSLVPSFAKTLPSTQFSAA